MKNNYTRFGHVLKLLFVLVTMLIGPSWVMAQTAGDYRSAGTGTWSTNGTWQRYDGTTWVTVNGTAPNVRPGAAAGAGTVTIRNGHTVTINESPANAIGAIQVGEGTSGILTYDGAGVRTLNVNGEVLVKAGGQFNMSGVTATRTHVLNIKGNLNIENTGTFDMQNGATTNRITNVTFNGTSAQTISATTPTAFRFRDLTINNPAGVTLNASTSVLGNLSLSATATGNTFALGSSSVTLSVSGTTTLNQPSADNQVTTFNIGDGTANLTGNLTFTNSNASASRDNRIVINNGTMDLTGSIDGSNSSNNITNNTYIHMTGTGNNGLLRLRGTVSNAGTRWSLGNGFNQTFAAVAGNVEFNSTAAQTIPAFSYNNLTISGARAANNITLASSGTISVAGTFSITATGTTSGFITTTSTVNFNGSSNQTIPQLVVGGSSTAAANYVNLTVNGSGTKSLAQNTTVTTTLNLTAGDLDLNGKTLTMSAASTITRTDGTISAAPTVSTVNVTYSASALLTDITTGPELPDASTLPNALLTLTVSRGASSKVILGANASVVTGLTISANSTLDLSTFTANRTASGGTLLMTSGTLRIGGTNTFPSNYTTYTLTTSTVEYYGTTQDVRAFTNYNNVIISGSGTKSLIGTTTVGGALTVNNGATLEMGAQIVIITGATTVNSGGTISFNNATGLKRFDGAVTVEGIWNESAAVAVEYRGNLTVNTGATYTASTGAHTFSTNTGRTIGGTISSLTIPTLAINTGTTNTLQSPGLIVSAALSGTATLTQGNNAYLNIGGTFTGVTLTVTATGNTVEYSSGSGVTIRNTTYENLTISGAGAKTISAGAVTVNNQLTINDGATLAVSNQTLTVNGPNIIFNGSGTITNTTAQGTFGFGGSTSGIVVPSILNNIGTLVVNNTNGVKLAVNTNLGVGLTLTAGLLDLDGNSLTLATGGTVTKAIGTISNFPTYSGTVNLIYNPTTSVNIDTDNEFPSGSTGGSLQSITINHTGTPNNTVNLMHTATINSGGSLTLTDGIFKIDNGYTLSLGTATSSTNTITRTVQSQGKGLVGNPSFVGTVSVTYTAGTATSTTLETAGELPSVADKLTSLTINVGATNTVKINRNTVLANGGTLTLTAGVLDAGVDDYFKIGSSDGIPVTINRASAQAMTGNPVFNAKVNISYTTASQTTGSEIPSSVSYPSILNNLTINATGFTINLNSIAIVNGTLALTAGTFTTNGNLRLAEGAYINRSATAATLSAAPTLTGSSYNLIYSGTTSTGVELLSAVNNLTINGSMTLSGATTVNGILLLQSGTFTAGSNLTMASGSTIHVWGGILSGTPTASSGAYNVAYSNTSTLTTANELEISGTASLNNVSVGGTRITGAGVSVAGSGYTTIPTVTVSDPEPGGVKAVIVATGVNVTTGAVTGFTLLNPGSGYSSTPTVTCSAPVSGTTATVSLTTSAAGNLTLHKDITVNGLLALGGILDINTQSLTYNGASLPTSSSSRYIQVAKGATDGTYGGRFKWNMNVKTAGAYVFPVGPKVAFTGYRPITITTESATASGDAVEISFANHGTTGIAADNEVPLSGNTRVRYISNINVTSSGTFPTSSVTMQANSPGDYHAVQGTGTLTSGTGSTALTGQSSAFNTEFNIGTGVYTNTLGNIGSITSTPASATSATLTSNGALAITTATYYYIPASAGTGTITTSTNSKTVTGVSSDFLNQLQVGDFILNSTTGVTLGTVASIASATSLTLAANATAAVSVANFRFRRGTPETAVVGLYKWNVGDSKWERLGQSGNESSGSNPITYSFSQSGITLNTGDNFFVLGASGGADLEGGGTYVWNGSVNTDWTNEFNWTPPTNPTNPYPNDASHKVSIPNLGSSANYPVIGTGTTINVNDISIMDGANVNLTLNGTAVLNVSGNFNYDGLGTVTLSDNSTVSYSSPADQNVAAVSYGNLVTTPSVKNVNYIRNLTPSGSQYFITGTGTITTATTSTAVTGTGTNFNTLAPGSILLTTGGFLIGTVASITDASTLTLTANATSNLTTGPYNYVNPVAGTGTISVTSGSNAVTGSGTDFSSLKVGDALLDGTTVLGTVASITNTTSLTLFANATTTYSGSFSTFSRSTLIVRKTFVGQTGTQFDLGNPCNSVALQSNVAVTVYGYDITPTQRAAAPLHLGSSANVIFGNNIDVNLQGVNISSSWQLRNSYFPGTNGYSGTLRNLTVYNAGGATFNLNGDITVNGKFTSYSGSGAGWLFGSAATELRTMTFNGDIEISGNGGLTAINGGCGANVVIGGSGTMTGQLFNGSVGNLTINRTAGDTIRLGSVTIFDKLTLTSGPVTIGSGTLAIGHTASTAGWYDGSGGTKPNPQAASIVGDLSLLNGTTSSSLNIRNIANGSLQDIPSGLKRLNNLTLNNTNGFKLNSDMTLNGTLTLTLGAFDLNAQTLSLNGGNISVGTGTLTNTATSNLVFGGSTASITLPSSLITSLGGLTINNTNGVSLNGDLSVGTLTLTNGRLNVPATKKLTVTGALSASSSTSYVGLQASTAIFEWTPASVASASQVLPVGLVSIGGVTGYRPITIKPATTLTSPVITVNFAATGTGTIDNDNIPTTGNNRTKFIANVNVNAGFTSELTMEAVRNDPGSDFNTAGPTVNTLAIFRSNSTTPWERIGQSSNGTNGSNTTIKRNTVVFNTGDNKFVIGVGGGTDLPVDPVTQWTNSGGDNNWNNTANWSSGIIPNEAAADVTIDGSYTVNISSGTINVNNLTLDNGATLNVVSDATLTVNGSLTNTGGTFNPSGGRVIYNSATAQNVLAGTYKDLEVTATVGATKPMQGNVNVTNSLTLSMGTVLNYNSNTLTLSDDATIIKKYSATSSSSEPLSSAPTFAGDINLVYENNSTQDLTIGVEMPPYKSSHVDSAKVQNVTIRGGGTGNVYLTNAASNTSVIRTINGTLTLEANTFHIGRTGTASTTNTTLNVNGPIVQTSGTIRGGTNNSGILVIGGSGNIPSTGIVTASTFKTLTMDRANETLKINGAVIVSNTLSLTNGALDLNNNSFTLNGDLTAGGSGTITGSSSSNLTINGTGALSGSLNFTSGSRALNNFTLNRTSSGTATLGTDLDLSGTLTLTNGVLSLGSNTLALNGSYVATGTGTLTAGASSTVTVGGSGAITALEFTNNEVNNFTLNRTGGATYSLGSNFTVGGTLTLSNGTFSVGNNTLSLNGPAISGSSSNLSTSSSSSLSFGGTTSGISLPSNVTALNNMTVNNSNDISLNANLAIGGSLTMSAGKLITGSNTVTLGNTATISETATSYVLGLLQTIRTVGTGSSSFGGLGVNLGSGAEDMGNVTVLRTSGTAGIATGIGNTGIARSWSIEISGTQPSSGRSLTLSWPSGDDNGRSVTTMRMFRKISGDAGWTTLNITAQNATGSGGIRSITATTNHFSDYTVSDDANTLPVKLVSFTATKLDKAVKLAWVTATEQNAAYFAIERSYDSKNFTEIATTKAAGNSNATRNYVFVDNSPLNTSVYYRLRQVDLDGSAEYSPVVSVRSEGNISLKMSAYPNPFVSDLVLQVDAPRTGKAQLRISDMLGNTVGGQVLALEAGSNVTVLDSLGSLRPGIYFLHVGMGKDAAVLKVIKR